MLVYCLMYKDKVICQTAINFEGGLDISNMKINTKFNMEAYTKLIIEKIYANENIETFICQINNIDKLQSRMYRKIIKESKYIDIEQIYKLIRSTYKLAIRNCNWLKYETYRLEVM